MAVIKKLPTKAAMVSLLCPACMRLLRVNTEERSIVTVKCMWSECSNLGIVFVAPSVNLERIKDAGDAKVQERSDSD